MAVAMLQEAYLFWLDINKIKSLKKYKNNQTFRNAFINFEQEYNSLNNKVEIIRASGNFLGKEVDLESFKFSGQFHVKTNR